MYPVQLNNVLSSMLLTTGQCFATIPMEISVTIPHARFTAHQGSPYKDHKASNARHQPSGQRSCPAAKVMVKQDLQ